MLAEGFLLPCGSGLLGGELLLLGSRLLLKVMDPLLQCLLLLLFLTPKGLQGALCLLRLFLCFGEGFLCRSLFLLQRCPLRIRLLQGLLPCGIRCGLQLFLRLFVGKGDRILGLPEQASGLLDLLLCRLRLLFRLFPLPDSISV